ncbi:MAG: tRNA lysidine(34) synthetase TilS [Alistipes sp.]|jgi:tRNA(Ile)-lysidine synthase|nr:tRNA lysidine(34) synthetase TilS [Alistipes sp.]
MLIDKFKQYITDNELLKPGDRVLVAVSGGIDSMSMLSLFAQSEWPAAVAHCNFQLRGREGDEDTELVKSEAVRYGLPCHSKQFDTLGEMERTGESVQVAARRLRYEWFNELCVEHGYTAIAIAHQADDSVETFFINLFRGTGLRGLTGIHPVRGRVVRPLLFTTRKEIAEYAHASKIAYREDSSNRSTKYLRNKIRLGLVPRLREINPRFIAQMQRNVDRLTQTQGFIDAAIARIRGEVERRESFGGGSKPDGGSDAYGEKQTGNGAKLERAIIDTTLIDKAFPVGFVIYELMSSGYGFRGDVIDAIVGALEKGSSGRRFYSRDWVAFTDRSRIIIEPIAADDVCEVAVSKYVTKIYAGNAVYYMWQLDVDQVDTLDVPENTALLDADKLRWPLTLRRWTDGDRFVPLGMSGTKKVSDYLTDIKMPVPEKGRQFVLVNGDPNTTVAPDTLGAPDSDPGGTGGEIVWLAGRRIDDRFKITPETENVLKIVREVI